MPTEGVWVKFGHAVVCNITVALLAWAEVEAMNNNRSSGKIISNLTHTHYFSQVASHCIVILVLYFVQLYFEFFTMGVQFFMRC